MSNLRSQLIAVDRDLAKIRAWHHQLVTATHNKPAPQPKAKPTFTFLDFSKKN